MLFFFPMTSGSASEIWITLYVYSQMNVNIKTSSIIDRICPVWIIQVKKDQTVQSTDCSNSVNDIFIIIVVKGKLRDESKLLQLDIH